MARVNIEDSLAHDERMKAVIRKIGEGLAFGEWYRIARCAQRYWLEGCGPIPFGVWEISEFCNIFVDSGLVQKTECGYYLSGSSEHFAWIISKKENGKKGGRPRKNNDIEKANGTELKANESYENPLTLTPSLAPTHLIKKESSLISSSVVTNKGKINHAEIVDVFNLELGGVGRVKRFASHSFSPEMINNFNILIGYPEFSTKELLKEYFKTIAKSSYLTNRAPVSLTWVLNPNNAFKVVSGQFQDFEKSKTKADKIIESAKENIKHNPFRKGTEE